MHARTAKLNLGLFVSKPRQWPPMTSASLSPAAKLAERRRWQPLWRYAQVLCLLVVGWVAQPQTATAGENDVRSGTLFFSADDGMSIEAPCLHTDVTMQVTGIVGEKQEGCGTTAERAP